MTRFFLFLTFLAASAALYLPDNLSDEADARLFGGCGGRGLLGRRGMGSGGCGAGGCGGSSMSYSSMSMTSVSRSSGTGVLAADVLHPGRLRHYPGRADYPHRARSDGDSAGTGPGDDSQGRASRSTRAEGGSPSEARILH